MRRGVGEADDDGALRGGGGGGATRHGKDRSVVWRGVRGWEHGPVVERSSRMRRDGGEESQTHRVMMF